MLQDFDLVLFGGSGDLSMRKLLPAMYSRDMCKDLPPSARVICVGRNDWSLDEFIAVVEKNARPNIKKFDHKVWEHFLRRIVYVSLNATDVATNCYPLAVFTSLFNVTGLPAISVPIHHDDCTGLPVGIQIVATPWREDLLLQAARTLELAHPWADRRPDLRGT